MREMFYLRIEIVHYLKKRINMKNKKYSLFIGRFQPFHNGHDYIIRQALDKEKSVWIALRDTPLTEWDPYTAEERVEMIEAHYKNDDVVVTIIPDIESVNIGRKVGYDVIRYDAPEDIEGISATQIRSMMADGNEEWREKVPEAVADFLVKRDKREPDSEKGLVIWFTGMSGAGKSTLAERLKPILEKQGNNVKILDGDEVRTNLTSDLGFSKEDRSENIKRIAFVAKSIADVGGVAICAAISPYKEDREKARNLIGDDRFLEVFADCHIDTLVKRDVKGLYKKALAGEIKNFTGISDPYEIPENPQCVVRTGSQTIEESLAELLDHINMDDLNG